MTEYLTEQEQIQQLKNWLKQYGLTILAGVILAFAITASWHLWQNHREKTLLRASAVYDRMLIARAQGDSANALIQAKKLLNHYARTPYAQMAAFIQGRDAVLKKNYAEASKQFNWVIKHSTDHSIQEIARIRLARVLITEKKATAALALLDTVDDKNFNGLVDETRGDAYVANNDLAAAKKAYQLALQELPDAEVTRPILQMKLDNLAN